MTQKIERKKKKNLLKFVPHECKRQLRLEDMTFIFHAPSSITLSFSSSFSFSKKEIFKSILRILQHFRLMLSERNLNKNNFIQHSANELRV